MDEDNKGILTIENLNKAFELLGDEQVGRKSMFGLYFSKMEIENIREKLALEDAKRRKGTIYRKQF